MPLTLSVALIVLGVIALIGLIGYWIDEAVEPVRQDKQAITERPLMTVEQELKVRS